MTYKTEKEAVVERLADILLGEKLPLDIRDYAGAGIIVPARKKVNKTMLAKVYQTSKYGDPMIDPAPIRNKVLATIADAKRRFALQGEGSHGS